jgi:predicted pyridoxine 5'-phosphate oxidase superfamily flavin-nucleotide-binding protein
MTVITTLADLEALYGEVGEASRLKETDRIVPAYRAFIEAAPFAVLATSGPEGLDCSPRGDDRIDSLRNIVRDPKIALLFMIPGRGETLRVNGRAAISADSALLESFSVDGKPPRTALVITAEAVFFQCSRAIVRSDLWNPARRVDRASIPSAGQMLAALTDAIDGQAYDEALPDRVRSTLY